MKTILQPGSASTLLLVFITIALSGFAIAGIDQIPFHPDESTYLYTSQDFETFLHSPLSMAWYPEDSSRLRELDRRLYQRLLDAPILRYTLGLGRFLTGQTPPAHDWEWALTWQENQHAGALPAPGLLNIGRVTTTLFYPLSLIWLYWIGRKMNGSISGLAAMLFFGLNTLTLLHGRRAMAEGVLIWAVLFAIWGFLKGDRRPWLAGLGAALAFNTKQSAVLLLPVGLLAVIWPQDSWPRLGRKMLWNTAQYGTVFLLVTLVLNPFIWRYPVQAAQASWQLRQSLSARQTQDAGNTGNRFETPAQRAAAILVNLYIAPPAFAEYNNYSQETYTSEQLYLANPLHRLLRSVSGGGILLGLTLLGMALAILRLPRAIQSERRTLALLMLSTLALFIGLAWLIGLPWQRYVMPLIPLVALWQGYALSRLSTAIVRARTPAVVQTESI